MIRKAQNFFIVLWRNTVWIFFAFLMMLSGVTRLIEPTQFVPAAILSNLSAALVQVYGVLLAAGGLFIIIGIVLRVVNVNAAFLVESAGYWLVLPSILLAFTIFVLTGTWNRLEVDITYLLFSLVVLSRITELRRDYVSIKAAERALVMMKDNRA